MGTTRRRASSSITSTSARVSSRSIVFATFFPYTVRGYSPIQLLPEITTPEAARLCLEPVSWLRTLARGDRDFHVGRGRTVRARAAKTLVSQSQCDIPVVRE